jgi:hypothetical protein
MDCTFVSSLSALFRMIANKLRGEQDVHHSSAPISAARCEMVPSPVVCASED